MKSTRGVFLSDLHLQTRRSIGQSLWDRWLSQSDDINLLVLGGDIFDFRWSRMGNHDLAIEHARQWLDRLMEARPDLRIVYLLGNHDCAPTMQDMLTEIALTNPLFEWYPEHWQLGTRLFLHGDVLDAGFGEADLPRYRLQFQGEAKPRGNVATMLYDVAVATRLHSAVPKLRNRPAKTCLRLGEYLETRELGASHGITDVYFGHTHVPIDGLSLGGLRFYNPGSGVRHLPFIPHRFECD